MIHLTVGIDVSKDTLDISASQDGRTFQSKTTTNDEVGFREIHRWLKKIAEPESWRICLEATSAYHKHLALWFAARGVGLWVMNPKQARDLAKGLGILRKSDSADATVLARCARMAWREPTPLPSGKKADLQEISRRIDVLTRLRADEKRRLQKPASCEALLTSCLRTVAQLDGEIMRLESEWRTLLAECPDLLETHNLIGTVPGVGPKTARVLISELFVVERRRTARECAAYAGVAPHEQTSGTSLRKNARTFSTGNKRLRCALYMGCIGTIHHDSDMKSLYDRITAQGKAKKVAIVATMNKMIRRVAAVANRGTPWVPA
jgi:transposase